MSPVSRGESLQKNRAPVASSTADSGNGSSAQIFHFGFFPQVFYDRGQL